MRIVLRQPAGPDCLFCAESAAAVVGQRFPARLGDRVIEGAAVDARVAEDGRALDVTVEVADGPEADRLRAVVAPPLRPFRVGVSP